MRKTHRYRRLFASDLIKVDKKTNNVDYTNDRAKQLNLIEKLVTDKPAVVKEKEKPKEKVIEEETPKELIRSSRSTKGARITKTYEDEFS
jgi:hypothetical protein